MNASSSGSSSSTSSSSSSASSSSTSTSYSSYFFTILGAVFLLWAGFQIYNYLRRRNGLDPLTLTGNTKPSSLTTSVIDGKTKTVLSAKDVPTGNGSNYGVHFWMFINNWDYRFNQQKEILKRVSSTTPSDINPAIYLDPAMNTLHVRVSLFASDQQAGAATPSSTSSTGDSFTCSVENVPLQSWFSVSVTVFQRNLDVYINGRLVKSCVLPGVPKPALGDMTINDNGGFAGGICNINYISQMITPEDAKAFYDKGTSCEGTSPGSTVPRDSFFVTLFGYTFKFSTLNKEGKELNSFTF